MRGLACYFFLSVLTQIQCSSFEVIGLVGRNVTLPCRYDMQTHGLLGFCWGRGKVPMSKCSNTILSSSDGVILSRAFRDPKYQLLGRVTDGDVSLTILNAQWSDAGVYGCRVGIPGWFNDDKVNTYLVMEEDPVEQPITQDYKLATSGRQEVLTTSGVGGTTLDSISDFTEEEQFKAFLEVGNIGRMAAIFLFTIIIILVFIFSGRRLLQRKTLQHPSDPVAENIYESLNA